MNSSAPMPESYYRLLEKIQAVDFVLVDLTLYLDTHPNDFETIKQFNQLAYESKQLKASFEEQFGPLLQYGGSFSQYPWDWKQAPWPWQV